MPLDIRILGPLEVERDEEVLELGGRRQRAVLAVLVLHAHQAMSPERLADAVWDGQPPASADTTLRGYVSNLRKVLEPDRAAGVEPKVLRSTPTGYLLEVADDRVDVGRFEQLVASGRQLREDGDVAGAVRAWSGALALWRGEPLQDFAGAAFSRGEAARLTELRLGCTEDLLGARLELGEHEQVVGDLGAFSAAHPARERALALLMLALYRCGRQADALTAYADGQRRLADELGVDPSPEIRELHEQVLRQDPALAMAPGAAAPSGKRTLTFLLGDIERSTERLRALGDEYAAVLGEHRRILTEVLTSCGGYAVRAYGGDQVFAGFATATEAVRAAVTAQLALRDAGLDDVRTLSVRMGLHTGEATLFGDEYVGLAVHLAARIMQAAHGGQILLSQATAELSGTADENIAFVDMGLHDLKDVPHATRLFQLTHSGLRRDFPPLRTRAGSIGNLPSRLTSFVGRDRELQAVARALGEARLVTLTGVGGVGKTRLAIESGRRLESRYPDGVWFCELAAHGNADALHHGIATTLGVQQQPGRSMRESLLVALDQRESLLILDNCEHLLAPIAELVEDIVRIGHRVRVLATSREALNIEGELARPVPSLSVRETSAGAVRLFADRAAERRPDFVVGAANASEVADICAKLDGIPLAIELAAARVTSMSPAQIARRLDDGFHFLRSGRRMAVDRHRTLNGAIEWSYALLTDAERLLFDRLSVFAGGFTLEAAEAVCGSGLDLDVADGLASLVAKSMVDADVSGDVARYSLLETMRQYGQDRLAERGETDQTLQAHAVHFVRMLEEEVDIVHGDSEVALRLMFAELDNLRAAQAWARSSGDIDIAMRLVAAQPAFHLAPDPPEMYAWAEDAVAMQGAEGHPSLPIVLAVAAMGAERRGELARGRHLLLRALELLDDADDPRRSGALYWLVAISRYENKLDEARRWSEECLRVARANDDRLHQASAYWVRTLLESTAGDHAAAVGSAEAGYALARDLSSAMRSWALYFLGEALNGSGREVERALASLEESVRLCRANGLHFWAGVALVSLASLRARHGDPVEALPVFDDVVDRWRRAGDWARQWVTLRNLAELFSRLGLDEAAAVLVTASKSSATSPPAVGPQGDRLEELLDDLAERMGAEAFAATCERARALSDEEAVAYAKAEIDRALEANRVAEVQHS